MPVGLAIVAASFEHGQVWSIARERVAMAELVCDLAEMLEAVRFRAPLNGLRFEAEYGELETAA